MDNMDLDDRLQAMKQRWGWVDADRYREDDGFFVLREQGAYYIGVLPLMYTGAVIIGSKGNYRTYLDRWCYHSVEEAIAAGDAWSGEWPSTEPEGWHRHPATGRRRENGDPSTEEVRM